MSDPKCETCEFYNHYPLVEMEGECTDSSKIIWVQDSKSNDNPNVFKFSSCSNHSEVAE